MASSIRGNVTQLHAVPNSPVRPQDPDWADVEVICAGQRPRIPPGRYQARSTTLKKFDAYSRSNLELAFDVYDGDATNGRVLARIPMFLRDSKHLRPNTKLWRLLSLVGAEPRPRARITLHSLRHKLFVVEINDTKKHSAGPAYSVVGSVLEKL